MLDNFTYDLIVIGAGSGGVRAARIAASHGAKVAICESDRVGGTCVIRGCVPKKLLVNAAHFPHLFEDAAAYGFEASATFSWARLRDNVLAEVTRLEGIYTRNLAASKVTLFPSHATLISPTAVKLASGETLEAKKILIATGGQPFKQAFEGAQHCLTSNDVFTLEKFPKSILIVGGGYIAVEFAGMFNGLGAQTHLAFRGEQLLRGFDADLQENLTNEYLIQNIKIHAQTSVLKVENTSNLKRVTFTNGQTLEVEAVLLATGRVPNTQNLGLSNLKVSMGEKGEISVNQYSQTNIPSLYAVGDVTDRVNLTPVAIREGHAFADREFNQQTRETNYDNIPTAVFSSPELGTCGLTQEEAVRQCDITIFKTAFRPMFHTLTKRETKMFMKLIVDTETQKILGAHMMGDGAGEMIQLLGIALKMNATKQDFDATMAVHPTAAEEWVTMRTPSSHHKKE